MYCKDNPYYENYLPEKSYETEAEYHEEVLKDRRKFRNSGVRGSEHAAWCRKERLIALQSRTDREAKQRVSLSSPHCSLLIAHCLLLIAYCLLRINHFALLLPHVLPIAN